MSDYIYVAYKSYNYEGCSAPEYVGSSEEDAWRTLYDDYDFISGDDWHVARHRDGRFEGVKTLNIPSRWSEWTKKKPAYSTCKQLIKQLTFSNPNKEPQP